MSSRALLLREASSPDTAPDRLALLAAHKAPAVARLALLHPALPAGVWRERLLAGDPEAWDSPQAPLGLLAWQGEGSPSEAARKAAVVLAGEPNRCGPNGRRWITEHLAGWWSGCSEAHHMLRWLGQQAAAAGEGSPEHRRVVLLACLCSRATTLPAAQDERIFSLIEAWAWGGDDQRLEARNLAFARAYSDPLAGRAARAAADAATLATAVRARTAGEEAAAAAFHADRADADARAAQRSALADLIRAAAPQAPLRPGRRAW